MDHAPREAVTAEPSPPAATATASVAAPALAGLARDAGGLARLDPRARAHAAAALHARGGNALVARRLARKALENGRYAYDRSTFNEQRFDGEVDPVAGTITIVLKVRYEVDGASFATFNLDEKTIADAVGKFKRGFEPAVRAVWEDRWSIRPSAPVDTKFAYKPRVRIVEDANPHAVITLMWPKAGFASNVERHRDVTNHVMQATLTVDDNESRTVEWTKRTAAKGGKPEQIEKIPFAHVTAAHEFGHLIDLRHSNQDKKSGSDEYGGTYEQAADVMGYGTTISKGDYAPWLRVGEAYSAERMPGLAITWSVGDIAW
jgi:hypothetical protein